MVLFRRRCAITQKALISENLVLRDKKFNLRFVVYIFCCHNLIKLSSEIHPIVFCVSAEAKRTLNQQVKSLPCCESLSSNSEAFLNDD